MKKEINISLAILCILCTVIFSDLAITKHFTCCALIASLCFICTIFSVAKTMKAAKQ